MEYSVVDLFPALQPHMLRYLLSAQHRMLSICIYWYAITDFTSSSQDLRNVPICWDWELFKKKEILSHSLFLFFFPLMQLGQCFFYYTVTTLSYP
jgi:hypothetical protein